MVILMVMETMRFILVFHQQLALMMTLGVLIFLNKKMEFSQLQLLICYVMDLQLQIISVLQGILLQM